MKIAGREIGPGQPPYIIAEASCNHCGKLEYALELIKKAKQTGASAIKFQAYTADTITLDCDSPDFVFRGGPWDGRRLYELYSKTQTPIEWFPALFECARENNITAFASVFDRSSIDALEKLDCPAYKIASMEIVDIPLIQYAAKTGKPLIISTGMASEKEIDHAMIAAGNNSLALACISEYPAHLDEIDFSKIGHSFFVRGISDHSGGWDAAIIATALGAEVIEKHFRLSEPRSEDYKFSLAPVPFELMVEKVNATWRAMRNRPNRPLSRQSSHQLRRSLYVVADIAAGELFTEQNVRSIRPSYGLPPKNLPEILGRRAIKDIKRGTALAWDLMEPLSSSPEDQDHSERRSFQGF